MPQSISGRLSELLPEANAEATITIPPLWLFFIWTKPTSTRKPFSLDHCLMTTHPLGSLAECLAKQGGSSWHQKAWLSSVYTFCPDKSQASPGCCCVFLMFTLYCPSQRGSWLRKEQLKRTPPSFPHSSFKN